MLFLKVLRLMLDETVAVIVSALPIFVKYSSFLNSCANVWYHTNQPNVGKYTIHGWHGVLHDATGSTLGMARKSSIPTDCRTETDHSGKDVHNFQ